mmetsp:Transcript_22671/g.52569  ORF Transcript_22671/g.52569 Transcript_22671/m.52569 type:complete len:261 (-) Transcript_22671:58-840(-)
MLIAYKRNIRTVLSQQLVNLRQSELDFYTTNIQTIGTQSALLAGFAFTIIAGHSSRDTLYSLYAYQKEKGRSLSFVVLDLEWLERDMNDGREIAQVGVEIIYLIAATAAMGSTLYTLYTALISTIIGPELALRGPEGSVDRAIVGLADVNREVIVTFRHSLIMFYLVVIANAALNFHLIASLVTLGVQVFFINHIRRAADHVAQEYEIEREAITTGHFAPDLLATRSRYAATGREIGQISLLGRSPNNNNNNNITLFKAA